MAYTLDFSLALGGSKTGLTMAAQIVDTSGGDVGGEITSGFTEIGQGYYLWNYASIPDAHRGGVKFYEDGVTGTILAFASINPEEAENLDASVQTVDTVVDAVKAKTDNLPADPASETNVNANETKIDALNDIAASDVLTTALTESYAADGAAPTLAQALFAIQQFLQERDVSDTTITVKKLDGSTTAYTLTINNAATPTNITRSG